MGGQGNGTGADVGAGGDVRVRGQNGRRIQKTRVQPGGWTVAKRKLFLDTLAATCNVTTAARTAGMEAHSAYAMRRREPGFSDLWEQALDTGYRRLEEELLQRALGALEGMVIDPDASPAPGLPPLAEATPAPGPAPGRKVPAPGVGRGLPVEYQLALTLLARRDGRGASIGARKRMDTDEVNAMLSRKLAALAVDEERAAARRARATAGDERVREGEAGAGGAVDPAA